MKLLPVICALSLAATLPAQTAATKPAAPAKKASAATAPVAKPRPDGLYAVIHTREGAITLKFFESEAPKTVRNWVLLARGGKSWVNPKTKTRSTRPMYPGTIFHRVMPGFMIQGGDPSGTGEGMCDRIPDEWNNGLVFDIPGRVGMANAGDPNSAGCQYFITETPQSHLNGKFTVFAQAIEGLDVVKKIANAPRNLTNNRPNDPVKIDRITLERWDGGKPGEILRPERRAAPAKKAVK